MAHRYAIAQTTRPSDKMDFDWHSDTLTRATPVTPGYKNTQNVRRFMLEHCGPGFKFDRPFMAWIRNDIAKNLGDVVDEWQRRNPDPQELRV